MQQINILRITKILLIGTVALWGIVGAFHNVISWSGTTGAVAAVTSMATLEGTADGWQATSNQAVVLIGALFIVLSKVATGLMCLVGAMKMWMTRNADAKTFAAAKEVALAGCAVAIIMLFGGFIVIAESWFELWRSDVMRAPVLEAAFRYAALIALIALFVNTNDD